MADKPTVAEVVETVTRINDGFDEVLRKNPGLHLARMDVGAPVLEMRCIGTQTCVLYMGMLVWSSEEDQRCWLSEIDGESYPDDEDHKVDLRLHLLMRIKTLHAIAAEQRAAADKWLSNALYNIRMNNR